MNINSDNCGKCIDILKSNCDGNLETVFVKVC